MQRAYDASSEREATCVLHAGCRWQETKESGSEDKTSDSSDGCYQLFLHNGYKTLTINGMGGSLDVSVRATHTVDRSECRERTVHPLSWTRRACCTPVAVGR